MHGCYYPATACDRVKPNIREISVLLKKLFEQIVDENDHIVTFDIEFVKLISLSMTFKFCGQASLSLYTLQTLDFFFTSFLTTLV